MKPRNAFEKTAVAISAKLPEITPKQKQEGLRKAYPYGNIKRQGAVHTCLECGHKWRNDGRHTKYAVCPECGKKCEVVTRQPEPECRMYCIMQAVEGVQVFRYVMYSRFYYKQSVNIVTHGEAFQYYLDANIKKAVIARPLDMNWMHQRNPFVWNKDMILKDLEHHSYGYYGDFDYNFIGHATRVISLIPELKRYGYKLKNNCPHCVFIKILNSPHMATMYETGQLDAFQHLSEWNVDSVNVFRKNPTTIWQLIKICTRHGCIIKDYSIWEDYVKNLHSLGYDIHSPKYICLSNSQLKREHDRMERIKERKQKAIEKERTEKELLRRKKDGEEYAKRIAKYLPIILNDGKLSIYIIPTIEDMAKEGNAMHHCVFRSQYYNRKDCIILSARIGRRREATIELNILNMQIVQVRAACNKASRYDKRIRQLINKNLYKFKKAA